MRDGIGVIQKDCVASGEKVDPLPGKYKVVVNSCDYGVPKPLEFEVKSPSR
jgi:hypothetical protein